MHRAISHCRMVYYIEREWLRVCTPAKYTEHYWRMKCTFVSSEIRSSRPSSPSFINRGWAMSEQCYRSRPLGNMSQKPQATPGIATHK